MPFQNNTEQNIKKKSEILQIICNPITISTSKE